MQSFETGQKSVVHKKSATNIDNIYVDLPTRRRVDDGFPIRHLSASGPRSAEEADATHGNNLGSFLTGSCACSLVPSCMVNKRSIPRSLTYEVTCVAVIPPDHGHQLRSWSNAKEPFLRLQIFLLSPIRMVGDVSHIPAVWRPSINVTVTVTAT